MKKFTLLSLLTLTAIGATFLWSSPASARRRAVIGGGPAVSRMAYRNGIKEVPVVNNRVETWGGTDNQPLGVNTLTIPPAVVDTDTTVRPDEVPGVNRTEFDDPNPGDNGDNGQPPDDGTEGQLPPGGSTDDGSPSDGTTDNGYPPGGSTDVGSPSRDSSVYGQPPGGHAPPKFDLPPSRQYGKPKSKPPTGQYSPPTGQYSPPTGQFSPPTGQYSPPTGQQPPPGWQQQYGKYRKPTPGKYGIVK